MMSTTQNLRRICDATGTQLVFATPPQRIVCVTSNGVDMLASLDLLPAAMLTHDGATLAAHPRLFGPRARQIARIGGSWFTPDVADIIAAQPDLVIGYAGIQDELRAALAHVAPVFLVAPHTYTDAMADLRKLGAVLDRSCAAEHAVQEFRTRLTTCAAISPRTVTPLVVYGCDTQIGVSTNRSLVGSLLAEITPYPWALPPEADAELGGDMPFSIEQIAAGNPDLLLVVTKKDAAGRYPTRALSRQLADQPEWNALPAVQAGQVHEVDADVWHSTGGICSLGIVLDAAMALLYPTVQQEK
ncbi:MAG: ABC transporter substrate-binding protein [Chloroflexaceae bacterium]